MKSLNFEKFLQNELEKLLPNHSIKNGYQWAMFPAGKLFRPNLALTICQDLNPIQYAQSTSLTNLDILYFACALECHHSYSLVHDDLPSMDNDDFRRGRESTHKKFGEWKAILIGDGLLNISYEFLSKIKGIDLNRYRLLLKLFSHSMGPSGLIHGQTLDLSNEMTSSFENTLLTHKLKTARLIQIAITGSSIVSKINNVSLEKKLWRLGESVGILFQLLDDLSELSDRNIGEHEKIINPWLKYPDRARAETMKHLTGTNEELNSLKLFNTKQYLGIYFDKMNRILKENTNHSVDLIPITSMLDLLCSSN